MQTQVDQNFNTNARVVGVLERLRRDPSLQGWVLMAPTRALATLGVCLDDDELVQLLELVEAMSERPTRVTAHDVMTTDVITIAPESSTHEAARVLADNRISGLPALGTDGSIVGLLSVYDLLAKSGATVGDIMNREVTTVQETAPIREVRAVLVTQHLKRVPVVNAENRLVGIISRGDLVRELAHRWRS
jgi:CBS domain-containing protein